ncbi:MAG: OmpA family protein [Rubrivivax sp.]|nr:OmpA family protein [Rubrivivax sp.]
MKLQHTTTTARSRTFGALSLLAAAAVLALSACGSAPRNNDQLNSARSAYNAALANPDVRDGAPVELKAAADALNRADQALQREESMATVNNLAYLASQSVATAQAAGSRKASEAAVAKANAERDRMRLTARTQEADAATRSAQAAQTDARASQIQAQSAERDARASQRAADASQQQAAAAQQDAQAAQQRNLMLEEQLRDLNAKKTNRGMVITIGDVLFDTGRAELKSGGMRNMDKLVSFLQNNPKRRAQVEGFTDSVGGESMNQELSARRADAVRSALVSRGIAADRIGTQGYGEAFPVAGNDSAGGRQMNRRVEIVLSDDSGVVAPR